jgi:hypothetical protein
MQIDDAIEKVEFKYTALPADEASVRAFLAPHPSKQRDVFFHDTKALALNGRGVILRVRGDESTVKLRPAGLGVAIAAQAENAEMKIELDVAGKAVCSAKLDDAVGAADPFSDVQRTLLERYSPGVPWDDVVRLGPIAATVWEIDGVLDDGFTLDAEAWSVDHLSFVELSVKVRRKKADEARAAFHKFLDGIVGDTAGDQSRKTERVLRWLAG